MTNWKVVGPIVGGVIVLGIIGAITGGTDSTSSKPPAAVAQAAAPTVSDPSVPAVPAEPSPSPTVEKKIAVPDFVGMGLQEAQDRAQAAGLFALDSHDVLGQGRNQVFDRNWQVCDQNITPGEKVPADTVLDFGAVKLEETCP